MMAVSCLVQKRWEVLHCNLLWPIIYISSLHVRASVTEGGTRPTTSTNSQERPEGQCLATVCTARNRGTDMISAKSEHNPAEARREGSLSSSVDSSSDYSRVSGGSLLLCAKALEIVALQPSQANDKHL